MCLFLIGLSSGVPKCSGNGDLSIRKLPPGLSKQIQHRCHPYNQLLCQSDTHSRIFTLPGKPSVEVVPVVSYTTLFVTRSYVGVKRDQGQIHH